MVDIILCIKWFLVLIALVGKVFVIKDKTLGLWTWLIGDIVWVYLFLMEKNFAEASMFLIYIVGNIWGIWRWQLKEKRKFI